MKAVLEMTFKLIRIETRRLKNSLATTMREHEPYDDTDLGVKALASTFESHLNDHQFKKFSELVKEQSTLHNKLCRDIDISPVLDIYDLGQFVAEALGPIESHDAPRAFAVASVETALQHIQHIDDKAYTQLEHAIPHYALPDVSAMLYDHYLTSVRRWCLEIRILSTAYIESLDDLTLERTS